MHLASVFERFYRADNSASRSTEGTGIGLSLVKELVRLHGGTVGLASEVGVGSTFHVWIPRGMDHLPHDRISGLADPGDKEAQEYENLARQPTADDGNLPRSAMERWNKRANGVERADILDVSLQSLLARSILTYTNCSKWRHGPMRESGFRVTTTTHRWTPASLPLQ